MLAAAAEDAGAVPSGVHQVASPPTLAAADIQLPVNALRQASTHMVRVDASSVAPTPQAQKATGDRIALSLCDDMGCVAYIDTLMNADITRFIGVEINRVARAMCNNLNAADQSSLNRVDHSFACDVFNIIEDKIKSLQPLAIKQLFVAAPCEDMSLLRTLPRTDGKPIGSNPRPGLRGKTAKVFVQCLQVPAWVLKYNPDCEVFVEFVKFDDMPEDWDAICTVKWRHQDYPY